MKEETPQFYDTCRECRFAEFLDFETLLCAKSVKFDPETSCGEFAAFEQKPIIDSGSLLDIAEEVDDILEIEEEQIIEELKSVAPSEVIVLEKSETKPEHLIRTEPANKLIPFYRNVIRKEQEFILLKEPNGDKSYIRYDEKNVFICALAVSNENPLDILLMSHKDFEESIGSTKINRTSIKDSLAPYVQSLVGTMKGVSSAKIKDVFKKGEQEVAIMNLLLFNRVVPDLKIGQLAANSVFYIIEEKGDLDARKIKLPNGTEAILLSKFEAFTIVETKLEEFVSLLSKILFVALILIGMGIVLVETGWLVFIGILMIPLAIIIIVFFTLPLYFILSQIIKRF